MDEDDSQDELINQNASHRKGKRAAVWAISDDSDDVEEDSEGGESDSGEEEEGDHFDGEEDDEGEEEEDEEDDSDDEEEEDGKAVEGAVGGTSADLAGLSSDEDTEKCPICLNSFSSQPVATPESCEHYFCLDCILEWSKNANSCPVDRIVFSNIYLRKCYGGKVQKMITVQKPAKAGQEDAVDLDLEQTSCEVCGGSDREDRLLLCDGCDAGYHMECLTPPLDAVPVEEWFCPECEANNRHSRGSAEELSETDSLSSSARPTTSRSRTSAAGPTRAIARTQQSERVRASVNRHRITQARTAQLAPRYLMQSTWLDETINAVVAGLNTAVYIRDLTPHATSSRRRRRVKRRKSKKAPSGKGETGKAASRGVKRRKRKVRRTKSRKKLVVKKQMTPRGRIARSLGIVKPKRSSTVPTVYRPSEQNLGSMRADIGAASFSVYGDPCDLDPFVDGEEDEPHARVTSLLEAKRRGISHSALRSHQPVARPITASFSRRAVDVPQSGSIMEATPVPDLLGSILSGQSMLLMDSSDVVINRDGSLKATKPMNMSPALNPGSNRGSSSRETSTRVNPGMSPNAGGSSLSLHQNGDLPAASSSSPLNRPPSSQSSPTLSPFAPSHATHTHPAPHSHLPPVGHPRLQPPHPSRPSPSPGLSRRGANGAGAPCESHTGITSSSSIHPNRDSSSKSKDTASSRSQPKKAPTKPVWVDVSVLPRIPKIKRETTDLTTNGTSHNGSSGSNSRSSRGGSSSATTSAGGSSSNGLPETGIHSLAGDKSRHQSVDQQQGRAEGQAQRQRPDRAGPSSTFSNSFTSSSSSSSSSSTDSPASQPCFSSSSTSSSSSTVSFRINSSGNSWHSRRLGNASSAVLGRSAQENWNPEEEEAKKRRQRKDKQMLLASHTLVKKERADCNMYDPFHPTLSESSSSDSEAESETVHRKAQHATSGGKTPGLGSKESLGQRKQGLVHVKAETEEISISQEEPRRTNAQQNQSQRVRGSGEHIKVEKEPESADTNFEKQTTSPDTEVKKEPGLPDTNFDKQTSSPDTEDKEEPGSPDTNFEKQTLPDTKIKKEPELTDTNFEEQTALGDIEIKKEPGFAEAERCDDSAQNSSVTTDSTPPLPHGLVSVKIERQNSEEDSGLNVKTPNSTSSNLKTDSSTSSSTPTSDARDPERCGHSIRNPLKSETTDSTPCLPDSLDPAKTERENPGKEKRQKVQTPNSTPSTCKTDSSASSSAPTKKKQKTEIKSEPRDSPNRSRSRSRSPARDSGHGKRTSKRGGSSRERRSSSSSSERGRSRRGDRHGSGQGDRSRGKDKDKDRERGSRRSRSRERRARSSSDSSRSDSSDRSRRKRRRSRSKDRRRSRSDSSSSSRERSRRKKNKRGSRERNDGRRSDRERGWTSKDKRRGRSRSKSRSRSRSRSRSESRERRRDHTRPQSSSHYSRDKAESRSKDKKRPRSRSSSRDRRKKEVSSKSLQKTPGSSSSSLKDTRPLKDKKTEKDVSRSSVKEDKDGRLKKRETPSSASVSEVKKESKDLRAEGKASTELVTEPEVVKEIKKEKTPSLDMFEDSPSLKSIKKEEIETPPPVAVKGTEKEEIKEEQLAPIKESCEIVAIKSEPTSPESSHHSPTNVTSFSTMAAQPSPSTSAAVEADSLQREISPSPPASAAPAEPPPAVVLTAPVKQEAEQLSDSDDDFNVDVMLDNLDFVKSEKTEGSGATVRQDKEGEEVKNEGDQVHAVAGAKSKTPVKRVTWNIQEPDGPQPEKSASKLALYKLKLKQEGARRPSSSIQTLNQDIPGVVPGSDASKKGGSGNLGASSSSDGVPPERFSTTGQGEASEAEEGDLSRKDKYLKKLHMQERAIEEVKLAIKPFYQKRDINKDEYKEILRKAVQKVCHSKSGEINPVKVANLVKAYVDKYKHARKHKKGDDSGKTQTEAMKISESP